ncbi:hypothetical protein, partial [Klebsiella variicola]
MSKARSRLALRLAGLRLVRSIYAGWRLTPYPAYVPSRRLTQRRPGKRCAAGRSGAVPAVVPDGGINALSGLRSFPQAHTPVGPRKRSAAGRSGAVPAVVPDGGIHALSGLRSFPQAHTPVGPRKRSAAGR